MLLPIQLRPIYKGDIKEAGCFSYVQATLRTVKEVNKRCL